MRVNRKKLVLAMLEKDINQKQLAEISGVSRVTIGAIKSGKSCADQTAYKIAKALEMPLEKLVEG